MPGKKGRKPFQPTRAMRRRVEEMVARGKSREVISRAIGCSPCTLDKAFDDELKNGRARRELELNNIIWANARKGNASAIRLLHAEIKVASASENAEGDAPTETALPAVSLGKKEAAQLAAMTAGKDSHWGDDLYPQSTPRKVN